MRLKILLLSTSLIFFCLTLSSAQIVPMPKTRAGQMLTLLLNAIETDEPTAFIKNNFDEQFLSSYSLEEHLNFFKQTKETHGGFEVHKIIKSFPNRIEVIAKSKKQEAWRKIILELTDQAPFKIAGIGLRKSSPPGKRKRVTIVRPPDDRFTIRGETAEKIDRFMTDMESQGFSGVVLIAQQDQIILSKGYGYANREKKKIFSAKTVVDIGSLTKQFTAAAILKLEMMGKLSVTDSLGKFFPHLPEDKSKITLHHLLTHTAGLPGAFGNDYDHYDLNDLLKQFAGYSLKTKPGEKYRYSNVGFSLLAAVVERVSGVSYDEFTVKNLFEPAGMFHTGYILPHWNEEDFAVGYDGATVFGIPRDKPWAEDGPYWHLRGNGGILSTAEDMLKWHRALKGTEILSKEARQKMFTPYIDEGFGDSFYGYGWVIMETSWGTKLITHNGGNGFFASDFYRFPEDETVMFITSNNGEMSAIDYSRDILHLLFQEKRKK